MHKAHSMTVLAAALAGIALFGAGCSDQAPSGTVGQKVDRAADKMAAATDKAGDKMAAATDKAGDKMAAATDKAVTAIDDSTITTKVKAAVLAEPGLKTLQINVDTKDGVVTLAGIVDSQALKERATQVTQGVSGVKSVVDNLTIKTTG